MNAITLVLLPSLKFRDLLNVSNLFWQNKMVVVVVVVSKPSYFLD